MLVAKTYKRFKLSMVNVNEEIRPEYIKEDAKGYKGYLRPDRISFL